MYLHFFLKKKSSSNRFLLNLPYLLVSGYKTTRLTIMVTTIYYGVEKQKICASLAACPIVENNDVELLTMYECM